MAVAAWFGPESFSPQQGWLIALTLGVALEITSPRSDRGYFSGALGAYLAAFLVAPGSIGPAFMLTAALLVRSLIRAHFKEVFLWRSWLPVACGLAGANLLFAWKPERWLAAGVAALWVLAVHIVLESQAQQSAEREQRRFLRKLTVRQFPALVGSVLLGFFFGAALLEENGLAILLGAVGLGLIQWSVHLRDQGAVFRLPVEEEPAFQQLSRRLELAEKRLERVGQERRTLARLASKLPRNPTFQAILDNVLKEVPKVVDCESIVLFIAKETGLEAAGGMSPHQDRIRSAHLINVSEPLVERAWAEGESVFSDSRGGAARGSEVAPKRTRCCGFPLDAARGALRGSPRWCLRWKRTAAAEDRGRAFVLGSARLPDR